ncbi:hypothetical protein SAMN02745823_02419 [Sporobacter termitidis DSM 10068]|uniref:Glyoxalase-like domain-containing protein n=1 Tax=Sporobacter termitidis DSM 10068 TaxID=1123282 RepID=A0A1M5YF74_9FIRM|nr:VOC family protein [Sporobacter termitidis]SHI10173.1 hypothetical protein SAMN02745823_02419 [Sporobacter termitidis DSM 10068]
MSKASISMGALCIDAGNAGRLADFYARLLGWEKFHDADGWAAIRSSDGAQLLSFQTVEDYTPPVWPWEAGKQAQMMHLDLNADDVNAAVEFALSCGATVADTQYFGDIAKTDAGPRGPSVLPLSHGVTPLSETVTPPAQTGRCGAVSALRDPLIGTLSITY